MGSLHFEQLHKDATDRDCAAMSIACMLLGRTPMEEKTVGCGYWENIRADRRFEIARKLTDMRNDFSDRLKQMLLDGTITILGCSRQTGEMVHITDPDIIDFDDPVVTHEQFDHLLRVMG